MKIKIAIKSWLNGEVLFEYKKENNTIKDTVLEAIKTSANLTSADLTSADLRSANLRYADLRYADLRYANLRFANLRSANLTSADLTSANLTSADLTSADLRYADLRSANLRSANLTSADLRSANLTKLPVSFINLASRDMLFIFRSLKKELPFLKEKLEKGEVDGTQYEGDCACLIGTLANADESIEKICESILYYDKGLHNPSENWFWQIKKGDTDKNNQFAKHALLLINQVLKEK